MRRLFVLLILWLSASLLAPSIALAQPVLTPVTPADDDRDDRVLDLTPDGRFAVVTDRDWALGVGGVWRHDLWTDERILLTDDNVWAIDAVISEDGAVVVINFRFEFVRSMMRFDVASGDMVEIARGSRAFTPELSADGQHLYFVSNSPHLTPGNPLDRYNLYRYSHDTGAVVRLADGTQRVLVEGLSAGGHLAYWQQTTAGTEFQLVVLDAGGTATVVAAAPEIDFASIRFSPDARHLIFEQRTPDPAGSGDRVIAIRTYGLDTGDLQTPMELVGDTRLETQPRPTNRAVIVRNTESGEFTRIDLATGVAEPVGGAGGRFGNVSQSFRYQLREIFSSVGSSCGLADCVEVDLFDLVLRDIRPELPQPPFAPDAALVANDASGAVISWDDAAATADGYRVFVDGRIACGAFAPVQQCRSFLGPVASTSMVMVVPFNAGGDGTPVFAAHATPERTYVTGYTADEWARVEVAAQHFGIAIDDVQRFGVLALRYIHALGGSQGTEPLVPPPSVDGPVSQSTDWSDDADYEALEWVMAYYAVGPAEAQKVGTSVLVFFASLDGVFD